MKPLLLQWGWHHYSPSHLGHSLLLHFPRNQSSRGDTHQQGWLAKLRVLQEQQWQLPWKGESFPVIHQPL